MKTIFATIAAVAAIAFAGAASAAPAPTGYYVQAGVGTNYQSNRDTGIAYSAAVGKDFGLVRAEAEFIGTQGSDSNKFGNLASNLGNVNVYVQPTTVLGATPFVGGGIGYGQMYRRGVVSTNNNGIVFNASTGFSYPLTEKMTLVTQYRYFLANDTKYTKNAHTVDNYNSSVTTVGVRYAF